MHQVYIRTYGCQMNERDSDQVARMFVDRGGYRMTTNEAEADVILINTCSVRDQAEQKALGKNETGRPAPLYQATRRLRLSRLHGAKPWR